MLETQRVYKQRSFYSYIYEEIPAGKLKRFFSFQKRKKEREKKEGRHLRLTQEETHFLLCVSLSFRTQFDNYSGLSNQGVILMFVMLSLFLAVCFDSRHSLRKLVKHTHTHTHDTLEFYTEKSIRDSGFFEQKSSLSTKRFQV